MNPREDADLKPQAAPGDSRRRIVVMAALFEGGLVVLALFLGWLFDTRPTDQFHPAPSAALGGLAATLPLLVVMFLIDRLPFAPFQRMQRIVKEFIVPMFAECSWIDLAGIALLAGIGEEALFRGFVQTWLKGPLGVVGAVAAASVIFGLAHFVTPTYAVLAALLGAYLGGLMLYFDGNLLAPMITHALYDFCALVYLVHEHRKAQSLPAIPIHGERDETAKPDAAGETGDVDSQAGAKKLD
ncbi:MAG: CPBP family intramembrane metalloprotease [Planctomycetia bacterium]|nr:CPBP family intramembrane metalloprotease [Planctomycetia bacterium]